MAKTLAEIMAQFSPEEQAEIQAEAEELITAEITLRKLRKAYQLTQAEISKNLVVEKNSIDNLEKQKKQTDLFLEQ